MKTKEQMECESALARLQNSLESDRREADRLQNAIEELKRIVLGKKTQPSNEKGGA